jgi:hypothetical protein
MEEQPHTVRQHVRGAVLGVPGPVGGVIIRLVEHSCGEA